MRGFERFGFKSQPRSSLRQFQEIRALRRYSLTAGRGEKQRKNTFSCFDFPRGIFFLGGELFPGGENRPFSHRFLSFIRPSQLPPQYAAYRRGKKGPLSSDLYLPFSIDSSSSPLFEAGELGLGRGDD